jgi:hypothetical protein
MKDLGLNITRKEAEELAEIIRDKTVSLKRALFDSEIIDTYKSYRKKSAGSKASKNGGKDARSKK